MTCFQDAEEVYATLGRLFAELAVDPDLGPKLGRADTVIQYVYRNPDCQITARLGPDASGPVDLGETELVPEVVMIADAETAHRFWLGRLNLTLAMARGEIRAEGPVEKLLALMPLADAVFPRYRELLARVGRADLIEV